MRTTDLLIAAEMLEMAANSFGNHGCNDYEIQNTPENLDFVKRMIAESDYPEDAPHFYGNDILVMDYQVMEFLSCELKQLATARAVAAAPVTTPPPCPDCGRPMTRREPWTCNNCGEEMDV